MRNFKKAILGLALVLALLLPESVMADAVAGEQDDNVVITENDRPYLSLGADLTLEQQAVVLELMGIDAADLDKYDVSYVTNEEEYEYLGAYISEQKIGRRAWSSVVIAKREKGSGIHISTKNINYCTIGMYKNALVTAGIEDADIIVAGPQMLSGTAALVGVFKAYTDMTGDAISDEQMDTALNELVLTGELGETEGVDTEDVETLIAYLKQQVAEGALKDEDSISHAIDDACEEFDLTLTAEQKSNLIELLLKMKDLDLNVDSLLSQAESVYDKLKDMGLENFDSEGFASKIGKFFSNLIESIKEFFAGLFS